MARPKRVAVIVDVDDHPSTSANSGGVPAEVDRLVIRCLTELPHVLSGGSWTSAVVSADLARVTTQDLLNVSGRLAVAVPEVSVGFADSRGVGVDKLTASSTQRPAQEAPPPRAPVMLVDDDFMSYAEDLDIEVISRATHSLQDLATVACAPAPVLYILGHSNGMDCRTSGILLCRRHEVQPTDQELDVYPCFHGSPCQFSPNKYEIVSPTAIQAQRLIGFICFGVPLAGGPFAARYTLGASILENPHIRSAILGIGPTPIEEEDFLAIHYMCEAGLAFGDIVARCNRERAQRGLGGHFVCLGDPDECVPPRAHDPGPQGTGSRDTRGKPGPTDSAPQTESFQLPARFKDKGITFDGKQNYVRPTRVGETLYATWTGPSKEKELSIATHESQTRRRAYAALLKDMRPLRRASLLLKGYRLKRSAYTSLPECLDDIELALRTQKPLAKTRKRLIEADFSPPFIDQIADTLCHLAPSVLESFEMLTDRGSARFMRLLPTLSECVEIRRQSRACPHCADTVDDFIYESAADEDRRAFGLCQSCGPIFEGDPELGIAIEVPETIRRTSPSQIRVGVANPYDFPVPICGVLVLQKFGTQELEVHHSLVLQASVHGQAQLCFDLPALETFSIGVHYLSIAYLAGARLNLLRRLVRIG